MEFILLILKKDKNATKFDKISYIEVLNKKLHVMDSTAITLCMDNEIPILVFDINKKGNLIKAAKGKKNRYPSKIITYIH